MIKFTVYTDGSFNKDYKLDGNSVTKGGIYIKHQRKSASYWIASTDNIFTDMHNVGGELLSVYQALYMVRNIISAYKKVLPDEQFRIYIVHDLEDVSCFLNRGKKFYEASKPGSIWYVQNTNAIIEDLENNYASSVIFKWVKSHSGSNELDSRGNDRADKIARLSYEEVKSKGMKYAFINS